MKQFIFQGLLFLFPLLLQAQEPWKNALMLARSADGITFNTPEVFQDSAGVPCVIRWKGDTLAAVFQWFRQPNPSSTWDRVAVRFSYDDGQTWTPAQPILMNGMPPTFQRPFDPTLALLRNDSLRLYFSSSSSMPLPGADSIIDTYSAVSADGIHFMFEPGARVSEPFQRVIDPAVIRFNNAWHYLSPAGAPQDGAFHYISPDGVRFSKVPMIFSDSVHNWTGNYMLMNDTLMRFYGSGPKIWFNSTRNGGVWNGYVNTNLSGGDPSALKTDNGNFLIIYTGLKQSTGLPETNLKPGMRLFPNPARGFLSGEMICPAGPFQAEIIILNSLGQECKRIPAAPLFSLPTDNWANGVYYFCYPGFVPTPVVIMHD